MHHSRLSSNLLKDPFERSPDPLSGEHEARNRTQAPGNPPYPETSGRIGAVHPMFSGSMKIFNTLVTRLRCADVSDGVTDPQSAGNNIFRTGRQATIILPLYL